MGSEAVDTPESAGDMKNRLASVQQELAVVKTRSSRIPCPFHLSDATVPHHSLSCFSAVVWPNSLPQRKVLRNKGIMFIKSMTCRL